MFTGLIEEKGKILNTPQGEAGSFSIVAGDILNDVEIGDSIAVNGTCLTVTAFTKGHFEVDVLAETLRMTTLGKLRIGDEVNLERAMQAGKRFGGHIVSGHIDGTGRIRSISGEKNGTWITIVINPELMGNIVLKGSVAIDGVSLTVANVGENEFQVCIIPHTGEETTLVGKKAGDVVNIEVDMIAKYINNILSEKDEKKAINITEEFLIENGF